MSEFNKQEKIDVLNNAKISMMDNFRFVKWLFHQIEEIKGNLVKLEGMNANREEEITHPNQWVDMVTFKILEAKVEGMNGKWEATHATVKLITN